MDAYQPLDFYDLDDLYSEEERMVRDTVRAWAKVTGTETRNGYGLVHLDIGMLNQDDKEAAPGTATIVLPLR